MFGPNTLAIKTIIFQQIKIYFKEFQFNVISPLVYTIIFTLIISTVYKYYSYDEKSDSYVNFLVPGMILLVVIQASFDHLSERIISMKQTGSFNDYLISPISRLEILFSFIVSSIFVCLTIAIINFFVLSFFTDFKQINYFIFIYYLCITITLFSCIGAITGFLSFTWDGKSSVSNFFVVPVSYLSGTFFSIDTVSKEWKFLFIYNPFYQLVKGFRSSFNDNYQLNIYNQLYILIVFFVVIISSIFIFKRVYKVIS